MGGFLPDTLSERSRLVLDAEPAQVAEAIQGAIGAIGKVTGVMPSSGTITGKIKHGMMQPSTITVQISKENEKTVADVEIKGIKAVTGNLAQKALQMFLQASSRYDALKSQNVGW